MSCLENQHKMEFGKQKSNQKIELVTVHANENLEAMPTVRVDKGMFPAVQGLQDHDKVDLVVKEDTVTPIDEESVNESMDNDVADHTLDDAVVKFSEDRVSKFREGSDGNVMIKISTFKASFEKDSAETKELGQRLQTAEKTTDELIERLDELTVKLVQKTENLGKQRRNVGVLRERSNLQVTCDRKYLAYSI